MRTQYCREHIDITAKECGLEESSVSRVKQAAKFVDEHVQICMCSTDAILALIKITDADVQALAISTIENALFKASFGGKNPNVSFTLKQVQSFIDRAKDEVLEARKKEIALKEAAAAEVIKASEEIFPEAEALPAIKTKAVEVIEVKVKGESAADEEGARNNPVTDLDEVHVAPKNSLKESYGQQVVGTNLIPDMKDEKPLGNAPEDIAVLIKTSQASLAALKVQDEEACAMRKASVDAIDSLEKRCEPLRAALADLEDQIKSEKVLIKRCDNERQRLGKTIIEQYDRILELKKRQV